MQVEFIPTDADVAEIKAILNIDPTNTTHNDYIKTMLPLLFESVSIYTNNNFGGIQTDGTIRIPGGVKIYMAKALELNLIKGGLKSRSMGSVSYTYDLETPDSVKAMLRPYKKVTFNAR